MKQLKCDIDPKISCFQTVLEERVDKTIRNDECLFGLFAQNNVSACFLMSKKLNKINDLSENQLYLQSIYI
jgi:hypothetical protein